jgi:hypothetical protein
MRTCAQTIWSGSAGAGGGYLSIPFGDDVELSASIG